MTLFARLVLWAAHRVGEKRPDLLPEPLRHEALIEQARREIAEAQRQTANLAERHRAIDALIVELGVVADTSAETRDARA